MSVKLLSEHHLEFLSLKGGYTGSSESTLVKMPHCWKSPVAAHMFIVIKFVHELFTISVYVIKSVYELLSMSVNVM